MLDAGDGVRDGDVRQAVTATERRTSDASHGVSLPVVSDRFRNTDVAKVFVCDITIGISSIADRQLGAFIVIIDSYTICILHLNIVGGGFHAQHADEQSEQECYTLFFHYSIDIKDFLYSFNY